MKHPYTFPDAKHPWYVNYTYFLIKVIFSPVVKHLLIKDVVGINNIPKNGPAIIAFNHQSYLDFICFIAVCPRPIHYLSAEKFFYHSVWKHLMKLTGQIKVHRVDHDKTRLHITVFDHLKNNKIIGIFPEGTRCGHPSDMLHAFTGVAKYAIEGMVPVIPVGIKGAFEVMSKHQHKPDIKKIISFHIGEPIHFTEHHGKEVSEEDLRNSTDKVMIQISKLSGKNYNHVGKIQRDEQ